MNPTTLETLTELYEALFFNTLDEAPDSDTAFVEGLASAVDTMQITLEEATQRLIEESEETAGAIAAAYQFLVGGVPSQAGFEFLIDNVLDTDFGRLDADGEVEQMSMFNAENRFINVFNSLIQGNETAQSRFATLVSPELAGDGDLIESITDIYDAMTQTTGQAFDDAVAYLTRPEALEFYRGVAEERILGLSNPENYTLDQAAAIVAAGAIANILVREDVAGLGSSIDNLFQNIADGNSPLPEDGDEFTNVTEELTDTVTLTEGTDVVTANVFEAPRGFTPVGSDQVNTLNDDDELTGTGPDATLNFTFVNDADTGDYDITPVLNNVAIINVQFATDAEGDNDSSSGDGIGDSGNEATLDLQDATGVDQVNISRIDDDLGTAAVRNLQAIPTQLSITDTNAPASDVVFSFVDEALEGTADETTLILSDVNVEDIEVESEEGTAQLGIEELNLVSQDAANEVGTLFVEDLERLRVTGDQDLTLGTDDEVIGPDNRLEAMIFGDGLGNTAGSLELIDASAFTGDLDISIGGEADADSDETSGVNQPLQVLGGTGDDSFRFLAGSGEGLNVDGGAGANTVGIYTGSDTSNNVIDEGVFTDIQALEVRAQGTGSQDIEVDTSIFGDGDDTGTDSDLTSIRVRNEGNDGGGVAVQDPNGDDDSDGILNGVDTDDDNDGVPDGLEPPLGDDGEVNSAEAPADIRLFNLSAAVALTIIAEHGTTGNNGLEDLTLDLELADDSGDDDTIGLTLVDATNVDRRFNVTLETSGDDLVDGVENLTITDGTATEAETESNTIDLVDNEDITGTITITGGQAGDFMNLDVFTASTLEAGLPLESGDDATIVDGVTLTNIYGVDTTGGEADAGDNNSATGMEATFVLQAAGDEVSLVAETIDASTYLGDVIIRVGDEGAADPDQNITLGSGDDTVIFDALANSTAGLSVDDTVAFGEGDDDTIAFEGDERVTIGESEWLNVSGAENILLVGNETGGSDDDADGVANEIGENAYNLDLTNDLFEANGLDDGDGITRIMIRNDNDLTNEDLDIDGNFGEFGSDFDDTGSIGGNTGVTVNASNLDSSFTFSYNGEEGDNSTVDRFILSDATINGRVEIDGGASGVVLGFQNDDILEVTANEANDNAQVTVGDLAGITNVSTLEFTNNSASDVTHLLELTDEIADDLVNDLNEADGNGVLAIGTEEEILTIAVRDNTEGLDFPVGDDNDFNPFDTILEIDLSEFDFDEGVILELVEEFGGAFGPGGDIVLSGITQAEFDAAVAAGQIIVDSFDGIEVEDLEDPLVVDAFIPLLDDDLVVLEVDEVVFDTGLVPADFNVFSDVNGNGVEDVGEDIAVTTAVVGDSAFDADFDTDNIELQLARQVAAGETIIIEYTDNGGISDGGGNTLDNFTITADNFSNDTAAVNGAGDDILFDDDANSTIDAGDGNNTVTTTGPNATVTSGSGDDTITTTGTGTNTVNAGDGNNTVTGGTGDEDVTTGSGDDTINTGDGADTISSGAGDDTINAGSGTDTVDSGAGQDDIDLGGGSFVDAVDTLIVDLEDATAGVTLANADQVFFFGDTIDDINSLEDSSDSTLIAGDGSIVTLTAGDDIDATDILEEALGTTALQAVNEVIYESTTLIAGDFFTQAGIDNAVNALITTFAANTPVANTDMLFVLYDSTAIENAAIFRFEEGAVADAGIQLSELTLIGVYDNAIAAAYDANNFA